MERILKEKLPDGKFLEVEATHQRIMKGVRGAGNKTTELLFSRVLTDKGIDGWVTNYSSIKGRPDFFFLKERIAVFIDGCFWHGCHQCGHIPTKNNEFWKAKIARNKERDTKTTAILRRQGISVLRFWEHEVKGSVDVCVSSLLKRIAVRRHRIRVNAE